MTIPNFTEFEEEYYKPVYNSEVSRITPCQKLVLTATPPYFCSYTDRKIITDRHFSTDVKGGNTTVNAEEIKKFQERTQNWWNPNTSCGILSLMNRLRVPLVRDGILNTCSLSQHVKSAKPLKGFSILDVGCGGGLLSEPLARLGAKVTGLDPGAETIKTAQNHAALDSELRNNLEYVCGTVEELSKEGKKYNAVVCSEVIEHVDSPKLFVRCCVDLVEVNGSIFFTTFNRTAFSYVAGILLAEYVLGVITRGTHEWKKFVVPSELKNLLQSYGCRTVLIHGMIYNPVSKSWSWSSYNGGTYALHAVKESLISGS